MTTKNGVFDPSRYSGIHPGRLAQLDLPARARARNVDLFHRPWKDSFECRLRVLRHADMGNYYKGILGGWQVDHRDPTADIRLLEFCLGVPTDQFLRDGIQRSLGRRALADRLPKIVLEETRKGLQAADWHEKLTAARDRASLELERMNECAPAARTINISRLRRLLKDWPSNGWERNDVIFDYRLALLRSISVGHFLRRASGHN
jgi:asparagine synthase (glutamine-hydrolysing)